MQGTTVARRPVSVAHAPCARFTRVYPFGELRSSIWLDVVPGGSALLGQAAFAKG